MAYDAVGNITAKSDVGAYTYPTPGSARPHAVASITGTLNASYSYDANGNLISGAGRTATWTSFNMPATLVRGGQTLAYAYDTEHNRIKQASASQDILFFRDGAVNVEKVIGSGGAVTWNNYIHVGGRIVAVFYERPTGTSQTRYFHHDHLGSTAAITDEAGAVVETLAYDAWGKRRLERNCSCVRFVRRHFGCHTVEVQRANIAMGIPELAQPLSFRSRDWTLLAALTLAASVHSLMTFPILLAILGIVLALQLAVLCAIDIRHWRLPNGLNALLALTGLVLSVLVLNSDPVDRGLAVAVGFVFLAALAWLYRHFRGHRGLGLGDAKLLGALGAWVGLLGLPSVVLIAATSGLAFSISRLIFGGGGLNQPLPFGPFLALGGWLVWVYGPLF